MPFGFLSDFSRKWYDAMRSSPFIFSFAVMRDRRVFRQSSFLSFVTFCQPQVQGAQATDKTASLNFRENHVFVMLRFLPFLHRVSPLGETPKCTSNLS